ncbi:hypothetical protein EES39_07085 [Streptomyces sp. ADI92-24]|nr:hypothetical protein EES39_07085 [Streptomyces sp. ADI92-24]
MGPGTRGHRGGAGAGPYDDRSRHVRAVPVERPAVRRGVVQLETAGGFPGLGQEGVVGRGGVQLDPRGDGEGAARVDHRALRLAVGVRRAVEDGGATVLGGVGDSAAEGDGPVPAGRVSGRSATGLGQFPAGHRCGGAVVEGGSGDVAEVVVERVLGAGTAVGRVEVALRDDVVVRVVAHLRAPGEPARVQDRGRGAVGRVHGERGDGLPVVGDLLDQVAGRVVGVGLLGEGEVVDRVLARHRGGESVVGVGVRGDLAHRVGDRSEPATRVVGPGLLHEGRGRRGVGRVARVVQQIGGEGSALPVERVRVDVAGRVGLLDLVAVHVVLERRGVAARVGPGRHAVVGVVGDRGGAGGVTAGEVGDRLRGDVAVGVVHRGRPPGVDGAGDPVGDRRVGLGDDLVVLVVRQGRGEAARLGVGHLGPGELTAEAVVRAPLLRSVGIGHLGEVTAGEVGVLGLPATRCDHLGDQPGRRLGGAALGRRGGGGRVRGGGGPAVGMARHRRRRHRGEVARRVVHVGGQVGVVRRPRGTAVALGEHQVVARVHRRERRRGVRVVRVVVGGALARRGVLAHGLGDRVAADVVAGDRPVAVGVGHGVQEARRVVAVCGPLAVGVDRGEQAVAHLRVVHVRQRLLRGVGELHRPHRGDARGGLVRRPVLLDLLLGEPARVHGDLGDGAGEVADVGGRVVPALGEARTDEGPGVGLVVRRPAVVALLDAVDVQRLLGAGRGEHRVVPGVVVDLVLGPELRGGRAGRAVPVPAELPVGADVQDGAVVAARPGRVVHGLGLVGDQHTGLGGLEPQLDGAVALPVPGRVRDLRVRAGAVELRRRDVTGAERPRHALGDAVVRTEAGVQFVGGLRGALGVVQAPVSGRGRAHHRGAVDLGRAGDRGRVQLPGAAVAVRGLEDQVVGGAVGHGGLGLAVRRGDLVEQPRGPVGRLVLRGDDRRVECLGVDGDLGELPGVVPQLVGGVHGGPAVGVHPGAEGDVGLLPVVDGAGETALLGAVEVERLAGGRAGEGDVVPLAVGDGGRGGRRGHAPR